MMRQTVRSEGGFTVPELMVAMTLSAMIMAGIFLAHKAGQDAYLFGSARIEVQQNARVAVNRMIEEIRRAGFDPTVFNAVRGGSVPPVAARLTGQPRRVLVERFGR